MTSSSTGFLRSLDHGSPGTQISSETETPDRYQSVPVTASSTAIPFSFRSSRSLVSKELVTLELQRLWLRLTGFGRIRLKGCRIVGLARGPAWPNGLVIEARNTERFRAFRPIKDTPLASGFRGDVG